MQLASYIDHTILKPDATTEEIRRLCAEAIEHDFAAVCVNPCYVALAAHLLSDSDVKVATVVGFPLGATSTAVKVYETAEAVEHKADEIDMVINLGAAKLGLWDAVADEIRAVVEAAAGRTVKVIVETALLTEAEKQQACQAVLAGGAQFIKTSTGFSKGGATVEDIALFKTIVGKRIGIKASGGIRTREQAEALVKAGATRLGSSAGVALCTK